MLERSIAAAGRFGQLGGRGGENPALHSGGQAGRWALTYLTRGVDNLCSIVLTAIFDRLAEGVLNRGIVAVYKVPLHELDRERRFPYGVGPNQFWAYAWSVEPRQAGTLKGRAYIPTDRLPTTANLRCFEEAGIFTLIPPSLGVRVSMVVRGRIGGDLRAGIYLGICFQGGTPKITTLILDLMVL